MATRRWMRMMAAGLLASGLAACGVLTQATVGYVAPPDATAPNFTWSPVPGAAAYQVVVSLDRAGAAPVATTGLSPSTSIDPAMLAWSPGHPVANRPYFWFMRAFDRNDPQGVLLVTGDPQEVYFNPAPTGITFGLWTASPMAETAAPSPSASTTPSPAPTPSP